MYAIVFRRDFHTVNDFITLRRDIKTLNEAKNNRQVSGDLVVDQKTNKIVQDIQWLWDWELNQENCYAQKAIAFG